MTSEPIPAFRTILISAAVTMAVGLAATSSRAQDTSAGFGVQVTTDGVTTGGWGVTTAEGSRARDSVFTSGSADLSVVQLKALAQTAPTGPGGCAPSTCSYSGQTTVSFWDTITLSNTTGAFLEVPYVFSVEGFVDSGAFGNATALLAQYFGDNRSRWFSNVFVSLAGDYAASGTVLLAPNQTRTLYWRAYLQTTALRGGVSDFSDTLTFDWDLPDGVTYASASGTFMSGAAVPEPAAWALMILGFGSAGAAIRARRRVPACA